MERFYIPYGERLASALACLLPQEQRDALRSDKVGSQFILNLFHFDHIELHAFGGADLWWNLDPKIIAVHREKSKKDTSIVAKAKRIDNKWSEFTAAMAEGRKPPQRKSKWPRRKLRSNKRGN